MKKNKNTSIYYLLCIFLLAFLLSCQPHVEKGTIIVDVNGQILTLEQLRASYGADIWDAMLPEEQRDIINQWIELTLLYTRAVNQEYFRDDIALSFISDNVEKRIYANALISHELHNLTFTNEEMYNYYRLREAEFTEQVREYRVQRIFLNSQEEMQNIQRMLDNREIQFTTAAIRYSQEAIGRNGGDMAGFITKTGQDSLMWVELERVGQLTEISMPYNDGWIIARWREFRLSTASRSFTSVRREIEEIMREERRADLYDKVLFDARTQSKVTIYQ